MACGSCPSGAGTTQSLFKTAGVPPEDALLLEYVGPQQGTTTFRSPTSALTYRFGRDTDTIGWVLKADAEQFIARGHFRMAAAQPGSLVAVATDSPALVAARTPEPAGVALAPAPPPPGVLSPGAASGFPSAFQAAPEPNGAVAVADGERVPEPEARPSAQADALAAAQSREALNAEAAGLGIEGAEAMPNKGAVAAAIVAIRNYRAAMGSAAGA